MNRGDCVWTLWVYVMNREVWNLSGRMISSQDRVVSIVTRLWTGWSGAALESEWSVRFFSSHKTSSPAFGFIQASCSVGTKGCFLRMKGAGTWGWPLTSKIKNEWSYISLLPICLCAMYSRVIRHSYRRWVVGISKPFKSGGTNECVRAQKSD